MKITILTYGSRGDIQPFLALAVGLQKAGHAVTLAAPQRFTAFISQHNLQCAPLAGDPDELSRMFNDAGRNPYRMVRSMQEHVFAIAPQVVKAARQALQGADLLVHSFIFTTGAHSFGRELGIPDVSVQLFPMFAPTRAFPATGAPQGMPSWLNYVSHRFSAQVFWQAGNMGYRRLRRLAPADFPARVYWPFKPAPGRVTTPLVFAISPVVLANPPEWQRPQIHMPGYFFLESPHYQPPDELQRFLEAGEPPVCVTFGSMVHRAAERITTAALAAIQATRQRAVFLTGWGGWRPPKPPGNVLFLDGAPHDWLFPCCKLVLHHGGAGTTAAGLRAGLPTIVVPHAADQPFWGDRVKAIGAGPPPIPINQLSADALEGALLAADSDPIRSRAAQIGHLIRAEDGVGQAIAIIEAHAKSWGS
ncbi:MAG: glycosyltransferase family 1 protein [Anaerolineales bacterium]|nr:glycosyltransferase family 1 protein [Anaerolineales bacterium]